MYTCRFLDFDSLMTYICVCSSLNEPVKKYLQGNRPLLNHSKAFLLTVVLAVAAFLQVGGCSPYLTVSVLAVSHLPTLEMQIFLDCVLLQTLYWQGCEMEDKEVFISS